MFLFCNLDNINDELPVCCDYFSDVELDNVLRKLKSGKASGADDIPPDFWKVLRNDSTASTELLKLCNHCLSDRSIPEFWKVAKIVLLFKKGDSIFPQNYRPISLLPVGYKILAALIHQRLIAGGVDDKITMSQFGFRPRRNCMGALMVVRRMIDAATEEKEHGLLMIFLDWAKAFDRIRVGGLVSALKRFGLPKLFVDLIASIYTNRSFFVQDHFGPSEIYKQETGIAQGCPLSPFLFIIVQSVMFHDIYKRINLNPEPAFVVTRELLYAGDTLLASSSAENLQILLNAVCEEGLKYGLELHWGKTFQMSVCHTGSIHAPNGNEIEKKTNIVYLGGLITSDGKARHEVSRRLGEGRGVFRSLEKLWSNCNLDWRRKLALFKACVTSKVM